MVHFDSAVAHLHRRWIILMVGYGSSDRPETPTPKKRGSPRGSSVREPQPSGASTLLLFPGCYGNDNVYVL